MKNENSKCRPLSAEDLTRVKGGYVIINPAGCYELYDDDGKCRGTFRGDQLEAMNRKAESLGISTELRKV